MIVSPQPSCHNRLKSLNSFSVSLLELHRKFDRFTGLRNRFEDFVIAYRYFINQIAATYGSQLKGMPALVKMYKLILKNIEGKDDPEIVSSIVDHPELSFIRVITEDDRQY